MRPHDSGAIGEDPGGEFLHTLIFANLRDVPRTPDTTFHVRGILKRSAKHFFLVCAMRTPERAIHLGSFCAQALGKGVELAVLFVSHKPQQPTDDRNNYNHDGNFRQSRVRWTLSVPFLLFFSALL